MELHLRYLVYFIVFEVLVTLIAGKIGDGREIEGAFEAVIFWVVCQVIGIAGIVAFKFGWFANLKVSW